MALHIYSARTGRLRSIITDDTATDAQLLAIHAPGVGEASHLGALVSQLELNVITGLVPANDRYVFLTPGQFIVTGVFIGDPDAGDVAPPGLNQAQHNTAQVGWRQSSDGSFQRSQAEITGDLAGLQGRRAHVDSPGFRTAEANAPGGDDPLTDAQIDLLVAEYDAAIAVFQAELDARNGPRP